MEGANDGVLVGPLGARVGNIVGDPVRSRKIHGWFRSHKNINETWLTSVACIHHRSWRRNHRVDGSVIDGTHLRGISIRTVANALRACCVTNTRIVAILVINIGVAYLSVFQLRS